MDNIGQLFFLVCTISPVRLIACWSCDLADFSNVGKGGGGGSHQKVIPASESFMTPTPVQFSYSEREEM